MSDLNSDDYDKCPYCGLRFETICDEPPRGPCEQACNETYGADPTKPRKERIVVVTSARRTGSIATAAVIAALNESVRGVPVMIQDRGPLSVHELQKLIAPHSKTGQFEAQWKREMNGRKAK